MKWGKLEEKNEERTNLFKLRKNIKKRREVKDIILEESFKENTLTYTERNSKNVIHQFLQGNSNVMLVGIIKLYILFTK